MTDILVLDFETFYSPDYMLKKLTTEAYIRSEQFEPLVMSMMNYNMPERGAFSAQGPEEIGKWIKAIDWKNTVVIAQNAVFDVGILSLRYGVKPKLLMCTMSMERGLSGPGKSASLAAMCERYGLPQKTVKYNEFIGKRFSDLDDHTLRDLVSGCETDVALTYAIAKKQLAVFPRVELPIVDMTIRMFTEPAFAGDAEKLREIAKQEFERKDEAMADLGVTAEELQSSAKFVRLLEDCGEEVPTKQGKLGEIPCVAKSDPYMQELATGVGRAGLLAQARLDVRSTLDENRAMRLAGSATRGLMPVALNYCGAATTRWSGSDKVNWQNLPGMRQDPEMRLRKSIMAPSGCKLVVADFTRIEYHILCALAGAETQLNAIRKKEDIYCQFGEQLYGRPITKADKDERNFSKKVVLGCGYGMGVNKFYSTCLGEGLTIEHDLAQRAVDTYRKTHKEVVQFWRECEAELESIAKLGYIELPNGLRCPFNLKWSDAERKWKRLTRYGETNYWGGGLTEFKCQSLARVVLSDVMLKIRVQLGLRPALLVHDELVYVVEDAMAQSLYEWLMTYMSKSPAWFPSCPMGAEGWIGTEYGK